METEHFTEEQAHKKGRHRKKQLYNSILQQMEFYFSDSNLTKDRFLSQLIQTDPYVDIDVFLKFNKIRKLTANIEDITKAVSKSELLELSDDKTKICRKLPVQVKENVDECTVYVERLKSDATHEWLMSIFSEFGNVVYVSIPKYKHNGMIKGFAFIEFENEDGAKAALEYFESINCKIPSHMEPEHLCSIATYEGDGKNASISQLSKNLEDREENKEKSKGKKHKHSEEKKESESKNKKRKHSNSGDDEVGKKKTKTHEQPEDIENLEQDNEALEASEPMSEGDTEGDEKKKKKHKKAHRKKVNLKEIGLQILSKKDWKKMRNRYLDMQKKTMKQLKMHLNRQRFNKRYESNKNSQTTYRKENVQIEDSKKNGESNPKEAGTQFIPGSIVKILLLEPCEENKKLKAEIKTFSSEIKYIDIPHPVGSQEIYVRFSDNKNAQTFCGSNFNKGRLCVLDGNEEKSYWEKIEDARQSKQKRSAVKQRGRDKLLKKAEKQAATHVRFDNNDSE
ncbi:hypothetical protein ILUMI_02178 [Ignelater luminosus]|uniref:La-related protein 7 n=1 Tax=Ignelater luminosus TaxID=2038154 RepID=A0A8K0DI71_IGNLU|nr:hypothetical protein ILUMI_02178 [Ignelater luminosus]